LWYSLTGRILLDFSACPLPKRNFLSLIQFSFRTEVVVFYSFETPFRNTSALEPVFSTDIIVKLSGQPVSALLSLEPSLLTL